MDIYKKYIIGVDVDGVLRDLIPDLYKIVEKYYPTYIANNKLDTWDFDESFTASREEIHRIYREEFAEDILGNGTPILKNIEYLKREIVKEEHEFVCISSQFLTCRYWTLQWLGNQFINFQSVYFRGGKYKWLVECDYLIDDSPYVWLHWLNGRGSDENFILIDTVYNQKVRATHRVKNIEEAMKIINE
jgi:5'(3')-deoxyribonucleotidase